ncbi:Uncharacterised protein [Paenibacillus thiaminolyticus]|nr:Uncharacterised protein [Paenibacillus thiaminolyticus]
MKVISERRRRGKISIQVSLIDERTRNDDEKNEQYQDYTNRSKAATSTREASNFTHLSILLSLGSYSSY